MSITTKRNCCGCCSLGTGTTIIAFYGVIESFVGIISYFVPMLITITIFPLPFFLMIPESVILSASIIQLVPCILLIVSVNQQKSILAMPWLVETLLVLIAGTVYSIFLLSRWLTSNTQAKIALSYIGGPFIFIIPAAILLLICGLYAYFWFNIFQFHRELKIAEKNKRKAAEDNETERTSVASWQSSLPDQNQATTQDSRAVAVTW